MYRLVFFLAVLVLLVSPVHAQSEGDIIISEVMPDPSAVGNGEGEYIELYNATTSDLKLSDWTLNIDGDTDDLTDVTVPADGFAVLCIDDNSANNGGIEDCDLDYPDDFSLLNDGSTISVTDANGTEIDRVEYDDGTNWPVVSGASMEYTGAPGDDNNTPANWKEAMTRKGDFAGEDGDFGSPDANASGGALPVELTAFDVTVDAHRALVTWATASETSNARFMVQHQGPSSARYRTLGTREGAGTTTRQMSYRFPVRQLRAGTHSFRLKQEDLDGTTQLSAPETVEVVPTTDLRLVGSNPVRAGEQLTVIAKGAPNGGVEVGLFNVLGQRIRTLASTSPGERVVRVRLSAENLSICMYFVRTECEAGGATARFTVIQ